MSPEQIPDEGDRNLAMELLRGNWPSKPPEAFRVGEYLHSYGGEIPYGVWCVQRQKEDSTRLVRYGGGEYATLRHGGKSYRQYPMMLIVLAEKWRERSGDE